MLRHRRAPLQLETLEDRTVPALLIQLDAGGNLTGIFGVPAGDVDLVFSADDTIQILENGNDLGTYLAPGNLTISFGNVIAATELDVDLGGFEFSGNMNITLGNSLGGYSVLFDDAAGGNIAGSVNIRSGSGPDSVLFDNANTVSGSVYAALGAGFDSLELDNGSDIAGNLTGTGVNFYDQGFTALTTVSGNVSLDGREAQSNLYFFDFSAVLGSVIINTGNGPALGPGDTIDIQGVILGNLIANLGGGTNALTLNSTSSVAGSAYVTGGSGVDVLNLASGNNVLGNLTANLGNGVNTAIIDVDTFIGGNQITYIGGNQSDSLTFLGVAPGARLTALLGNGTDVVTLDTATAVLFSAYLDFGTGIDNFISPNPIAFPITIRNLV